jgi:hypothetical protein
MRLSKKIITLKEINIMAEIKGHGVPGGHIEGAVGDIYVDERTGLKYRCTYAGRLNGKLTCEWINTGERAEIKSSRPQQKAVKTSEKNDI